MSWAVEYTDEFGAWYEGLIEPIQDAIDRAVHLLEARRPDLPFPHSSGLSGSRRPHLRELRVQSRGDPLRVFYAFDPRRTAILLIGGSRTGDDRFYQRMMPLADRLYDTYLAEIRQEGLIP